MAKNSALTWILKEAKRLRRRYPKRFKQWKDYVAQASAIYAKKHKGKSPVGKPKPRKKVSGRKPAKKKSAKKKVARKSKPQRKVTKVKSVTVQRTVSGKRRKSKPQKKAPPRRRSVSGKGGSNSLLMGLAIGGGLYLLLSSFGKQSTTTQYPTGYTGPQLQYSGNVTRNQQSQDLINYAIAAGLAANAIASLVNTLNSGSDQKVNDIYNSVSTTGNIGNWI